MDKEYNFQILLPNGTSFHLKLRIPEPIMPFRDFIKRVEEEYIRTPKQSGSHSPERKQEINWKGGNFLLVDADDMEIQNVANFMTCNPQECHILRLQDGLRESTTTFENMWNLTPDTDILKELPHEYTYLNALAHLIDNSLQAVWSNERRDIKHISVDVDDDVISIFDTGPGMDGSDENSIVKWGKMGASIHRFEKEQAIGGAPPYLKPFFGMFGYGGPIASMQLGRRALVSSKTKDSKKVYTLNLDRDALLSGSDWKAGANMRDPEEDEISRTPHGSFTKVEISEPRSKLDIYQLQCQLKDIYFPYIQYEDTKSRKTILPVKFEVNGVDLAEIQGGEIAITNLHSCNGPDFVLQLQFSYKQDNMSKCKSFDSKTYTKANARLKCVYFPIVKRKENIDRILEGLESEKCGTTENFETFSRVSIRRLGRLLPDARWGLLPFMDLKQKRGDTARLLKRCCMRVKCFIETDAGFNPTSSKTDLAYHCLFTTALRNFGNKPLENENDIKVQIYKDGNLLNPSQLKKDYEDWIVQMHSRYDDDEADCGENQPVFVASPANKKTLRISSEVARMRKFITRNGRTWKCGQRIKLLKGACAGVQKNNVYATIEYFLLEGLQDESGGEAQIICRPSSLSDEKGCILSVNDEDTKSLSIPLSVIDAGKCIGVERTEWEKHIERRRQRSFTAELLDAEQCQELEVDGVYENGTTSAAIKYSEGIACTFDSRGTCCHTNQNESIMDTRDKFRVISSKSNLLYMGVGDSTSWEWLAKMVAAEVKNLEESSKNLVTVERALIMVQEYLEGYLKVYPKNKGVFGGILVGWLPNKVYHAYSVLLEGKVIHPFVSLDTANPYLVLGSKSAEVILKKLARNPKMCGNAARRAAISTMVYATFNDVHTGGPIHVFVLRDGENITRDGGHEVLDPCAVHLQRSSFFSKNILLMLFDKNKAGPYTNFESFVSSWTMDASLAVKCTHSGQSFMFCINQYMSYAHLFEYICERFKFSATDDIELHYSLPGCAIFFLRNDDDFKMLFSGAKIYKLDCVDIMVLKNSVICSKKASVSFEDSCSGIVDEDDYLTEAFRTEVQKSYLSNEWASYIQCVGQKFRGGSPEFRDKLRKYAIEVGFSFVFIRNDWDRIHAVCSNWGTEGCEWNVHGYVLPANGCFIIGELDNVHSCKGVLRKQKHELLGSKIVKSCIEEDISYNLSLKPREIISKFKSAYGFDISYKVAWKAKQKAREMIYGSEADSFNMLTWYREAVFETNPGSSFVLEVDSSSNRFQRLFLAYAGCVRGFEFCLPILYVDGTFGKSVYKGQILCATGKNGNHGFFPLAMCVCDSETDANWSFFFQHLKNLLEPQGRKITFISDRGVGLLSAFDKIFPGNPHLFCYKHLVHNLMTKYNGKGSSVLKDDVKKKFFELAYSCTEKEYRFHLRELREAGGADIIDPFLADLPVQNWCRAFFPGCRYGIMANSIAESFNAWFAVEREMPVYTMLDQTRIRVMQMMGERRDEAQLWTSQLTPVMEGRLKEGMEKACRFNVHYSHTNVYEVRSKYSYVVDLGTPSCSCKKWEINCFPCCHGLAAIQAASLDVYAFMDKYFYVDYYKKCYDFPIYPISNVDMASSESASNDYILPPNAKRPPGRPRLKRFKSRGECEKKLIRCGRCGKMGQHNKKTCTEPI